MTNLASIMVRPALPEQGERAAELIYSTARPIFDFMYGADADFRTRLLALQWRAEEGLISHRHAMGAYSADGALVGLELGFDHGAEAAAFAGTRAAVRENTTADEYQRIGLAAGQLTYLTAFTPDGNYCVHNLAVTETADIPGLGRRLLEGAFERAAAAGYHTVCLDVIEGNPAYGFYRHLGMHLGCETRIPELMERHGMPAIYRMVREL